MLVVTFQVKAIPGTELDIKEVLALHCEPLGSIHFPNIERNGGDMVLTAHIHAPDGSVTAFNKLILQHLSQYRDTKVLGIREILPQQMEL